MATTPTARGFRLERHLQAIYDGHARCARDAPIRVELVTGLHTEYCIHTEICPTSRAHLNQNETEPAQIVVLSGINTPKESHGAFVGALLQHWKTRNLARTLQVLVFDPRGGGAANAPWGRYTTSQMAQDTVALMNFLGWNQAHIVGSSMGGMVALELAAQAPDRVASLMFGCTSRGHYRTPLAGKLGMFKMACSVCRPRWMVDALLEMSFPHDVLAQRLDDVPTRSVGQALHSYYQDLADGRFGNVHPPMHGMLGQGMAVATHYVSDKRLQAIAQVGFPILILGGRHDCTIPVGETELLADRLAGDHVRLLVFEDAGHGAAVQHLEQVVAALVAMMTVSNHPKLPFPE